MSIKLGGYPLVDPASIRPYYIRKGLSLSEIDRCNSQEFRWIDGYGEGNFLLTEDLTSSHLTLEVDERTVSLKVLAKLSLEHPNKTGTILYLYKTAEPKHDLKDIIVGRNYNVTIDKSLNTYGATTIHTVDPDLTPKFLTQIIQDFLPGYTIVDNIDNLLCFDVNIEGISALEALDKICAAYGYVWGVNNTTLYISKVSVNEPPTAPNILHGLNDPINDIRHSKTYQFDISDINVSFPIYDYCRHEPSEYHTEVHNYSGQGQVVNVMDPWYPAVVNALGSVRNLALLQTRAGIIRTNLQEIAKLIDYVAIHHYMARDISITPISLSEVHGDLGSGPRSVYKQIQFPYIKPVMPPSDARYADNWVGTLTYGYFGTVPSFVVTPAFGLDGRIPPGDQEVINLYNWNYGEPGFFVRVEWDCVNERWIALQQEYECPPTEDPEYGTGPTVPPYPLPPE